MADETTDPYRVAAEAALRAAVGDGDVDRMDPDYLNRLIEYVWNTPDRRSSVDAVRPLFEAAGREAAAQALNAAGEADGWLAPSWAEVVEIARGDR